MFWRDKCGFENVLRLPECSQMSLRSRSPCLDKTPSTHDALMLPFVMPQHQLNAIFGLETDSVW